MGATGMNEGAELLAIHHTVLVTWVVNRFGKALLIGTLVALLAAVVAIMGRWGGLLALSPFIGFLCFALYLASVSAPLPADPGED